MLDSASYRSAGRYRAAEKQQEPAEWAQLCAHGDECAECEMQAVSLAERITGIAPRPRKTRRYL
jgi:hypothetical protein